MSDASPYFFFDSATLARLAEREREAFRGAEPFPHVVLDDFLPPAVIRRVVEEFPDVDDVHWQVHGPGPTHGRTKTRLDKLAQSDDEHFPPFLRHLMGELNSNVFLRFLEALTGFEKLIPDPSYNQCGLHSTGVGGRLMIHTDIDRHPFVDRRLNQVLNLILFVNPDWKEEYGGHLELRTATREEHTRVLPIENRAVLFHTGPRSYHGHPEPLTCPAGRRRNSLAVYYYRLSDPQAQVGEERQMTVRWVPTAAEDFAKEREIQEEARRLRLVLAGKWLMVPQERLPAQVPEGWEAPSFRLDFFDVDALEAAQRERLLARVRDLRGQDGRPEPNLIPFGRVAPEHTPDVTDPLLLVLQEDGGVSLTLPLRPGELLFLADMPTFAGGLGLPLE